MLVAVMATVLLARGGLPLDIFAPSLAKTLNITPNLSITAIKQIVIRFDHQKSGLILRADDVRFDRNNNTGFDADRVIIAASAGALIAQQPSLDSLMIEGAAMRIARDTLGTTTLTMLNRHNDTPSAQFQLDMDIKQAMALSLCSHAQAGHFLPQTSISWRRLSLQIDDALQGVRIDHAIIAAAADLSSQQKPFTLAVSYGDGNAATLLNINGMCDARSSLSYDLHAISGDFGFWLAWLGIPRDLVRFDGKATLDMRYDGANAALSLQWDDGRLMPSEKISPDTALLFDEARLDVDLIAGMAPLIDFTARGPSGSGIHLKGKIATLTPQPVDDWAAWLGSFLDRKIEAIHWQASGSAQAVIRAPAGSSADSLWPSMAKLTDWNFDLIWPEQSGGIPHFDVRLNYEIGSTTFSLARDIATNEWLLTGTLASFPLKDALEPFASAKGTVAQRLAGIIDTGMINGSLSTRLAVDTREITDFSARFRLHGAGGTLAAADGDLRFDDIAGDIDFADGEWRVAIGDGKLQANTPSGPVMLGLENLNLAADADWSGGLIEIDFTAPTSTLLGYEAALTGRSEPLHTALIPLTALGMSSVSDQLSGAAQVHLSLPYFRWDGIGITPLDAFANAFATAQLKGTFNDLEIVAVNASGGDHQPWVIRADAVYFEGTPEATIVLSGNISINAIPATIDSIIKNLADPAKMVQNFQFDVALGSLFDPPGEALWSTLSGNPRLKISLLETASGKIEGRVFLDFTDATLDLKPLGRRKERGSSAVISGQLQSLTPQRVRLGDLDYTSDAISARGSLNLSFTPKFSAALAIDEAFLGLQTKLSATVEYEDDHLQAVLLDFHDLEAKPLIDFLRRGLAFDFLATAPTPADLGGAVDAETVIHLQAQRAVAYGDMILNDFALMVRKRGDVIHRAGLSGRFAAGAIEANFDAYYGGSKTLRVNGVDAGGVLRAFGFGELIEGGTFSIRGDAYPGQRNQIRLGLTDFEMGADIFARSFLGAVATRASALLSIDGDGASSGRFDGFDAVIEVGDGRLIIHKGLFKSDVYGLQFQGEIDLETGGVEFDGAYIPLATLDSISDQASESGVGSGEEAIGFTFTVGGAILSPDLALEPLSAFSPELLRRFFDF